MGHDLERRLQILGFSVDPIDIYGPFIISQFVNLPLLGVCWCNAMNYYTKLPEDRWTNKVILAVLLILTTLDAGVACSRLIKTAVVHGGDLLYFINIGQRFEDWTGELFITLQCLIAQAFMIWRAISFAQAMRHVYGRRAVVGIWIVSALLIAGWLLCAAWGLHVSIYLSRVTSYAQVVSSSGPQARRSYTFLTDVMISAFLALDLLITLATTAEFLMAKTGFGASNAVLDILVSTMLTNGLLVTLMQMTQLLTFHLTLSTWFAFPRGFLGKVHTITVIAILVRPKRALSKYHARIDRESAPTSCTAQLARVSSSNGAVAKSTAVVETGITSRCRSCGVDSAETVVPGEKIRNQEGLVITILRKDEEEEGRGMMGFRAALLDLEGGGTPDELEPGSEHDLAVVHRDPRDR